MSRLKCTACKFIEGKKKFISTLLSVRYPVKYGQYNTEFVYMCPNCGTLKINLNKGKQKCK